MRDTFTFGWRVVLGSVLVRASTCTGAALAAACTAACSYAGFPFVHDSQCSLVQILNGFMAIVAARALSTSVLTKLLPARPHQHGVGGCVLDRDANVLAVPSWPNIALQVLADETVITSSARNHTVLNRTLSSPRLH